MMVAITVFAISLGFNIFSYFRINHLLESSKNSTEANLEVLRVSTEELVRIQSVLGIQHNSDSGDVDGESLAKLEQIIYDMPQVTKKLAFIKEISKEEDGSVDLELDPVEWFNGAAADIAAREDLLAEGRTVADDYSLPNGFYIRNTSDEIERIKLETDVGIAVLNGARLQSLSYGDLIASDNQERLFNVSFVGDKVVLLEEKYRP